MNSDLELQKRRIRAARKEVVSDLVLKNGSVINLFSGVFQRCDVAVCEGVIVGVGPEYAGNEEIDVSGRYIIPGMIDGHLHIESTMLLPHNLAAALLVHGTTAIVSDPHEIANVAGLEGVRMMLEQSADLPFDFFFMAPSCVPATGLETSGAELNTADLLKFKNEPRILGLAEMMNFSGILSCDEEVLKKIYHFRGMIIDGHCPSLKGHELQAYMTAQIRSDHETSDRSEAIEKIQGGMMLMIREGSSAKNLEELMPVINHRTSNRCCFVSDDLSAEDILNSGHLDAIVKKALLLGLDPVTAVQMVTRNPAEYFGLYDRGAVAPGRRADMVVLDSLDGFNVISVYKNGITLVEDGRLVSFPKSNRISPFSSSTLNIAPLNRDSLLIPHQGEKARIIEIIPGQIITKMVFDNVKSDNGFVVSDTASDTIKLCVVERHRGSGRIGLGLVRGLGLKNGAIASSVSHDSHNVIAAGICDKDILTAIDAVRLMSGGLVVVSGENIIAKAPLEVAGLMSVQPIDVLSRQLKSVELAASNLGCVIKKPFMALSFLALPVIPELKLTDMGLVDVNRFEIVPLFTSKLSDQPLTVRY
ncbi:Adenine deaminase [uncultured Desulfobacterium sp.]|uniref:Adenine deaminase n=1 Tax=uncultured Desulfobacterium sp. TaxID=201089 RepID=A0A445N1I4_9BACT|nr:Adenine deaminase [uncultured Desulfobacterium sp.]